MSNQSLLQNFEEQVAGHFEEFNKLFLELPFPNVEDIGRSLLDFSEVCSKSLENGDTPRQIIEKFLSEELSKNTKDEKNEAIFKIIQFIERQVALFDAVEDAAFPNIRNLNGVGTLSDLLNKVSENNKEDEFRKYVEDYKVKLVLTAHPTQFYPASVLGIIRDLTEAIRSDDRDALREILLQMGKTSFESKEKPTPLDEAERLIWYLKQVFYESMPSIQSQINEFLKLGMSFNPFIEVGFWPGGDRDGNPFVTADITLQVAKLLRKSILSLYLSDVEMLQRRLTFGGVTEKLKDINKKITYQVYLADDAEDEEYLEYSCSDLLSDLFELREIIQGDHQNLFIEKVDNLILKVKIFGFHFASLDLRQDSSIHTKAIEELSTEDTGVITQISVETLETFRVARKIQSINGSEAIRSYIISNTQNINNLLDIFQLAQMSGFDREDMNFNIVPLFETIQDLNNAPGIMETLYTDEEYKSHLHRRGNKQVIMLGFSDGTKDGGYVTANWEIYKAKKNLSELAKKYNIKVIFFDGRGGPPARGGGDTRNFYRALGNNISHNEIYLTIQGQTVSSAFGTIEASKYNFEQLFTAGLDTRIFPDDSCDLTDQQADLVQELSDIAFEKYTDLRNHKHFVDYLEEATPLAFYKKLNIASRPTKRSKGNKKLSLSDLRAIPFVGAWTHMKQNVPAYFGFGSALQSLIDKGKEKELSDLFNESLFFKALMENTMQSLAKSYFPLTKYLANDEKFGDFWNILASEASLTERLIKQISGQKKLLNDNLVNKKSIRIRESIVLPLITIQHYAMQIIREDSTEHSLNSPEYNNSIEERIILKALPATVNASRNSV